MISWVKRGEQDLSKLHYYYGAMNSGKSMDLIRTAYNYEETGQNPLVTKPAIDTKGNDLIVSRGGLERRADFLTTPDLDIEEEVLHRQRQAIAKLNGNVNCLLVDESQFLLPNQVDQLFKLAVIRSIPVIAYGLRTDFQTHSFAGSRRLLEIAHEIKEVKTICADPSCGSKALFNARQLNGEYVSQGGQVAIDGEDDVTYKSLCGQHYTEHVGQVKAE